MDALSQISEIVRLLIAKISTLFDVIDLSFFVSGGTCMLAFVYMRYVHVGSLPDLSAGLTFTITILGSYVMGLLCFAIGRWIRRATLGRPWTIAINDHLSGAVGSHGIERDPLISAYLSAGPKRRESLYTRLWTELRQDAHLKPSFELIGSYWVRAAVYDGLIPALVVWALAVWRTLEAERGFGTQPFVGYAVIVFIAFGVLACAREAARSERYQVDELTATIAYACDKRRRDAAKAPADDAEEPLPAADAEPPKEPREPRPTSVRKKR